MCNTQFGISVKTEIILVLVNFRNLPSGRE
jgi:hypothetical protein